MPTATPEQILSLSARTATKIGTFAPTTEMVDAINKDSTHPYWTALESVFNPPAPTGDYGLTLQEWVHFYKKFFGLTLDLSGVKIPEKVAGFDRLIVVAHALTPNKVFSIIKKHFDAWRYTDDLDRDVPHNDRNPKSGTYAVWVRDVVEADEEMKNLSYDDCAEKQIKGITLLERLVLELKYFSETGKHLDIENWTLCSGSRSADGYVPSAHWNPTYGKFKVHWTRHGLRSAFLRFRVAVTL